VLVLPSIANDREPVGPRFRLHGFESPKLERSKEKEWEELVGASRRNLEC
jgi:hypothetical protein